MCGIIDQISSRDHTYFCGYPVVLCGASFYFPMNRYVHSNIARRLFQRRVMLIIPFPQARKHFETYKQNDNMSNASFMGVIIPEKAGLEEIILRGQATPYSLAPLSEQALHPHSLFIGGVSGAQKRWHIARVATAMEYREGSRCIRVGEEGIGEAGGGGRQDDEGSTDATKNRRERRQSINKGLKKRTTTLRGINQGSTDDEEYTWDTATRDHDSRDSRDRVKGGWMRNPPAFYARRVEFNHYYGGTASILGYLIFAALVFVLCLQHKDAMTLLLHYWLASSGDSSFFLRSLCALHSESAFRFSKWIKDLYFCSCHGNLKIVNIFRVLVLSLRRFNRGDIRAPHF
ncbi:hypothetical protein C8R43DRAFT_1104303 [Mycena crocata]|nr:hypothetical protein C8R43DRAFT_1104303 [Mycena crocata]